MTSTYPLRGPVFSTFQAQDVGWLLEDYSALALEAGKEQREALIQSGELHYADSLPVEYEPTPAYLEAYRDAVTCNAENVGVCGARLAADIWSEIGPGAVLVSLARAGVVAGILLRHLGARYYGADWHHYAISIVRDRGIDQVALRWLAENVDVSRVVFVDSWTGKGAIRSELTDALSATGFPDRLAVLADPAGVADYAGTCRDVLVPSACLNATVCGLISRTVLPQAGRSSRHGAKFYRELRDADLSADLLEALVSASPPAPLTGAGRRERSWKGIDTIARLRSDFALTSVHLAKPGLGETTRVLLRRVPWQVLVASGRRGDPRLAHIEQLASERGVPVVEYDTGPYLAVGLIRPHGLVDV